MAKLYGGRWKCTGDAQLGGGGQGDVFRVVDTSGKLSGTYALKRVRNPKRHDRFRSEIEAVGRLEHPNVIEIIDHSALESSAEDPEKQYLVMPLAAGGHLGSPARVAAFRDSLDSILPVAKQLVSALKAAHAAQVIHRDVKPENILFLGEGREIWLSDFGICLLRDADRSTQADEVVGPRSFMAPELEGGGQLEVEPAADIYSLGKVIYFMVSGGRVMAREQVFEAAYAKVFERGGRYHLLQSLLGNMITALPSRIKTMEEVEKRLNEIEAWESRAVATRLNERSRELVEKMQQRAQQSRRSADESEAWAASEAQVLANIKEGFVAWATAELEKTAGAIQSDEIQARVLPNAMPGNSDGAKIPPRSFWEPIEARTLVLERVTPPGDRQHGLELGLYRKRTVTVRVTTNRAGRSLSEETPATRAELELAMLVRYGHLKPGPGRIMMTTGTGYISRRAMVGKTVHRFNLPGRAGASFLPGQAPTNIETSRISAVQTTFDPEHSLSVPFRGNEWGTVGERLDTALSEALETFLEQVDKHGY